MTHGGTISHVKSYQGFLPIFLQSCETNPVRQTLQGIAWAQGQLYSPLQLVSFVKETFCVLGLTRSQTASNSTILGMTGMSQVSLFLV